MRRKEEKEIIAEMVDELLKCERYTKQDFANRWPYHPATFGSLLTQAEDIVRKEHGIEFRPGPYGTRYRANFKETFNRSKRQRKAGLNKLERSVVRMEVAVKMAPEADREGVEKAAETQKLQVKLARTRSRKILSAADD